MVDPRIRALYAVMLTLQIPDSDPEAADYIHNKVDAIVQDGAGWYKGGISRRHLLASYILRDLKEEESNEVG